MKNLLNKWLGGEATWDEEKQLRQATAKDDFLKEAIEGYDAFPNSNHAAAVDRLKGRLPKGKQQNNLVFSLPKVAAAAAIIGLVGTLFWVQRQVEEPAILSQNSPQITAPTPIEKTETTPKLSLETPAEELIAANEPAPIPTPAEKEIIREKNPPPVQRKKTTPKPVIIAEPEPEPELLAEHNTTVDATADNIVVVAEEPIEETAGIIAMEMSDPEPTREKVVVEPVSEVAMARKVEARNDRIAASSRAPSADMAKAKRSSSAITPPVKKLNYYVGQVQNEDGQPLHEVKIIGLDTKFNTITEMDGDFVLETDIPLSNITVSKDGFHTRKIALNQYSDFLNVSLVKKTTKVPGSKEMFTLAPKPVNGFVDFFDYLSQNRVYPKGAKESDIEREVEIRFYIDENGTPTNLKVSNPDVYGFDKEAIRLLENGPKWQPANSHARYYVPFEKE